jgi:hypothetical protein
MSHKEFCFWLRGFLYGKKDLGYGDADVIRTKLIEVTDFQQDVIIEWYKQHPFDKEPYRPQPPFVVPGPPWPSPGTGDPLPPEYPTCKN